jgi:hypothetical protein
MSHIAQTSHNIEIASASAPTTAAAPVATIAPLWPPVMLGFGVIITLAWTGGLSWLLVSLLRSVV